MLYYIFFYYIIILYYILLYYIIFYCNILYIIVLYYINPAGLGTCVDFPNSQGGTAISRLTAQLNQVIQEKNDILAQFCSQQSLIKEQQAEVKGLLRCKAENADLQCQVSSLNRTVAVSIRQLMLSRW